MRAPRLLLAAVVMAACRHAAPVARGRAAEPPPDTSGFVTQVVRDGGHVIADGGHADADTNGTHTFDADLRPDATPDTAVPPAPPPQPTESAVIPVVPNLTLTSASHFPEGDRENHVTLHEVSPAGILYAWHYREQHDDGTTGEAASADSSARPISPRAPRLDQVFESGERTETPGYTAMSLSRATYARVLAGDETPFTITGVAGGASSGSDLADALATARVVIHGVLTLASRSPEGMPILVNGRRADLPVMHLKAVFTYEGKEITDQYWILADSADPLFLRTLSSKGTFQMIRIDWPGGVAAHPSSRRSSETVAPSCPASTSPSTAPSWSRSPVPALEGVASLLAKHADWSVAIEGHTDSIGDPGANRTLSERRAEAVRAALVTRHVDASRITSSGFGASRPREANATLEGRARNRRVEVVRDVRERRAMTARRLCSSRSSR